MTINLQEQEQSKGLLLFTPSARVLRAGPVWVTISNWAFAAEERWGAALIVTPDGHLKPKEALALSAQPGSRHVPGVGVWSATRRVLGTLAKDVRAFLYANRFSRSVPRLGQPFQWSPFVWQHHDLFQQAGFKMARRLRLPLVLFVDAPIVWEARRWGVGRRGWGTLLERVAEIPLLRSADLLACVSEEVAEAVIELGAQRDRVLVTPCTADPDRFSPQRVGLQARRRLRLEGCFVVGWVGSFRQFHAVDTLVRSFAAALKSDPAARLLLVGQGSELESTKSLASQLGIQAVFTGAVPHEDVPDLVAAMDVAVLCAPPGREFHYSPLKLQEFLASGKPVVAPSVGQIARTLSDGVEALLYPPGDEVALASALRSLRSDFKMRSRLGAAGRDYILREGGMRRQLDEVMARLSLTDPAFQGRE